MKRTIYGMTWECLSPGRWRSECGWYVIQRAGKSWWVGCDLADNKREFYGSCMTAIAWQVLPQERRDYYSGKVK